MGAGWAGREGGGGGGGASCVTRSRLERCPEDGDSVLVPPGLVWGCGFRFFLADDGAGVWTAGWDETAAAEAEAAAGVGLAMSAWFAAWSAALRVDERVTLDDFIICVPFCLGMEVGCKTLMSGRWGGWGDGDKTTQGGCG
jgi:hypothetical protein